ncbi:MAG: hypothetical protein GY870_17230, partial [archaeon]|nr:hypothetical protein [archaeon]
MSSLTTSEEIQKQLSIIFGYSGREEIQVGDIIGVGSLTKNKVNDLIFEVLNYLNAYNGMLRDYSGTEVYAIEFELINFYKNEQNLRLLPKSMILIPGEYKDSNTLLLALKQESSQLNFHKCRNSIDNLGKLFFEVEEVVERPELKNDEKKEVLNKFAKRFSRKIQGQLLEGKWDKKLVGIKTSSPTEEKNLEPFISLQSKYNINWSDINRNITADPPKYRENKLNLTDEGLYKHLKWSISGPSGFYITQNTLNFGTQLLRIANTGSINEVQENLVKLIVEEIEKYLSNLRKTLTYEEAINEIKHILRELKDSFTIYEQKMKKFLTSGERGNSENLYTLAKAQFENIS